MNQKIIYENEITFSNLPLIFGKVESIEINHEGKTEHTLYINFKSLDNEHTGKLYHLNYEQFEKYVIQANSPNGYTEPKEYEQKIEKNGEIKIEICKSERIFLVLYKKSASKVPVKTIIKEEWEDAISTVQLNAGIPMITNQLTKSIRTMITEAKNTLKIISPHYDSHVIDEISSAINKGVNVQLIIRKQDNIKDERHNSKQALIQFQKLLKQNLKQHENIHARLIIKDNSEVLIMSSDINQDSMQNLINLGVRCNDQTIVTQSIEFFKDVWDTSKNITEKA